VTRVTRRAYPSAHSAATVRSPYEICSIFLEQRCFRCMRTRRRAGAGLCLKARPGNLQAKASTWRHELPPPGDYYPRNLAPKDVTENLDDVQLDRMLNSAGIEWRRLIASDRNHQDLLAVGQDQFSRIIQAHWKLIQEVHSSVSLPFFMTLAFWLFVIFLSFGLMAPRNTLVLITIALGAISIASVAYVIVDLDTLFRGMIVVSSHPLRDALVALQR
jgi:hypothetical protein